MELSMTDEKIPQSFLSWQGGKTRLMSKLLPLFPDTIRHYYEPFLGGGAVALTIAPRAKELMLSDKNPCLINAWQCVRDDPEGMTELMLRHKHQHERGRHYFYNIRKAYNADRAAGRCWGMTHASNFVYLNKACFNGSWRANKNGEINVTIGNACYISPYKPVSDRLMGASLTDSSFEIIKTARSGDVIYLDPPYYADRDMSCDYGVGRFTEDDRQNMVNMAVAASKRGALVVGSDYDTMYTRDLYSSAGFRVEIFEHTYTVGGVGKSRPISSELIYNNII